MKNDYIITTERMFLRGIEELDAGWIIAWRTDLDVYKYFKSPHAVTLAEHRNWFRNNYLFNDNRVDFFAIGKSSGIPVGVFGISRKNDKSDTVEVNYLLDPEQQGKGLASEAVEALIAFAHREWGSKYAIAEVHKENVSSIRLAEKIGMTRLNDFGKYEIFRKSIKEL